MDTEEVGNQRIRLGRKLHFHIRITSMHYCFRSCLRAVHVLIHKHDKYQEQALLTLNYLKIAEHNEKRSYLEGFIGGWVHLTYGNSKDYRLRYICM